MSVHKGAAALRSSFACRSRSPVFKRCCSASAAASLPCPCPRSWKSRASPTTRFTKWISAKSSASALIHFVNLVVGDARDFHDRQIHKVDQRGGGGLRADPLCESG